MRAFHVVVDHQPKRTALKLCNPEDCPLGNGEVETVQCGHFAVSLCQASSFDYVVSSSMLAVSSTRTAVIIPARAIETRMALPIGAVAQ